MDVDDGELVDADHSQSPHGSDSDNESDRNALPVAIHEVVMESTQALADIVQTFPNIAQRQRNSWRKTANRILESKNMPTCKLALIGKTGAGKSTLINCLLAQEAAIVPSSASGACTSATIEISYKDSDTIEGVVTFVSRDDWAKELDILLTDIHGEEDEVPHQSPVAKATNKILMIYPQLNGKNLKTLTKSKLLKIDPVKEKLGKTLHLPPSDSSNFRASLAEYVDSSCGLWPLVKKIEISGRFPVLSTGITLVDLPGYGDRDERRNNSAADYIQMADAVMLVADIKRANDEDETRKYIEKMMNQFIIDGRSTDESVIMVLTSADTPVLEGEVHVNDDAQQQLDRLTQEIIELRHPPGTSKSKRPKVPQIEFSIIQKEKEKKLLLANARISEVKAKILESFRHVNSGLGPEENGIPRLPVFCVGSFDFLAMTLTAGGGATIFSDENQTGILDLHEHIISLGELRRLKWTSDLLERANAFSENVNLYFSEDRHLDLPADGKQKVLKLIDDLAAENDKAVEELLEDINVDLSNVDQDLGRAIDQAIKDAPRIVKKFGAGVGWNTYRACMKRLGVFLDLNLNHELTKGILPHVQPSWNKIINNRIPLQIRTTLRRIENDVYDTISNVAKVLTEEGNLSRHTVSIARRSLAIETSLGDLSESALQSMLVAQRDSTRSFKTIVQDGMTGHYETVAQESGEGSLFRMKAANAEFIQQNAANIFIPISTRINELLHQAATRIKIDMQVELQDMSAMLRLTFIDEIDLAESHPELKASVMRLTTANRPDFESRKHELDLRRSVLHENRNYMLTQ
ncbi:hypothetical protein R3P38DRAFT_2821173 [Favolaschia claudopus]|uniref:G domain-containing protein n=1 Tax=Favolaschia claudopus TaxID=2862362 RepID=A0AAW0EGX3_9AGAR